jgi:hypothetical protein
MISFDVNEGLKGHRRPLKGVVKWRFEILRFGSTKCKIKITFHLTSTKLNTLGSPMCTNNLC